MVLCPKCGFDNQLGRMFCHKCGVKLELNDVRPPRSKGRARWGRQGWSADRVIGLAIRLLILAVAVFVIVLALQVPPAPEIKPTDKDSLGIGRKRRELERMIQQKKAGTIALSEAEINSCIGQIISEPNNRSLGIEPTTLKIELGDGDVTVVMIGKIRFGESFEKRVALRYMGVPTIEENRFVFKPTGGNIGRLAIHPKILHFTGLLDRYYAQLFHSLSSDRELLGNLAAISVDPKRGVELKFDPAERR
jgi:hypothetical protein